MVAPTVGELLPLRRLAWLPLAASAAVVVIWLASHGIGGVSTAAGVHWRLLPIGAAFGGAFCLFRTSAATMLLGWNLVTLALCLDFVTVPSQPREWPVSALAGMLLAAGLVSVAVGMRRARGAGVPLDVTRSRLAEEALRETAFRGAVIERLAEGLCVCQRDEEYPFLRFSVWNNRMEAITGYTMEEVNALGWNQTLFVCPEERERAIVRLKYAQQGLHSAADEWTVARKTGGHRVVEISTSILDPANADTQVLMLVNDVTERRQSERKLAEAEALLRAAVEQSPAGVLIADAPDVKLRLANAAAGEILGASAELLTSTPVDLRHRTWKLFQANGEPYADEDLPLYRAVLKAQTLKNVEFVVRRAKGEERWVSANASPVRDPDGRIIAGVVMFADVTEQKRAEQQILRLNRSLERRVAARTSELEAVNRELESFCYAVSHDLRAPLRAIDGFSKALQEDFGEALPQDCEYYLARIRNGAKKMGSLIDSLLQLSRLTRSQMAREKVDLSALAEEILAEYRRVETHRVVGQHVADGLCVDGDRELLRVALRNLLSNAWKFTSRTECACIEFGAVGDGAGRSYFVRDNGAGFDMEYKGKLFGAFQRLHSTSEFPGEGVGLATVQRIITRHGGRIWAQGAVGEGATFFFTVGERSID